MRRQGRREEAEMQRSATVIQVRYLVITPREEAEMQRSAIVIQATYRLTRTLALTLALLP